MDDDDDDDADDGDNNDVNRNVVNENDGPSNMMVDAPESQSNLNPVNLPADESWPKVVDETEDGWVQVARRRSRGKKIRLKRFTAVPFQYIFSSVYFYLVCVPLKQYKYVLL